MRSLNGLASSAFSAFNIVPWTSPTSAKSARAGSASEASPASLSAVSSEQDRTGTVMPASSNNGRVCSSIRWLNASLRRPRNEMSSRSVEMSVEAGIALGCSIAVDTFERDDLAAFAHDTKAEVAKALDREQVAAERFERQAEAGAPGVKQFASDEVDAPSFVAAGDGLECGRVWVRAFGKLGREPVGVGPFRRIGLGEIGKGQTVRDGERVGGRDRMIGRDALPLEIAAVDRVADLADRHLHEKVGADGFAVDRMRAARGAFADQRRAAQFLERIGEPFGGGKAGRSGEHIDGLAGQPL